MGKRSGRRAEQIDLNANFVSSKVPLSLDGGRSSPVTGEFHPPRFVFTFVKYCLESFSCPFQGLKPKLTGYVAGGSKKYQKL